MYGWHVLVCACACTCAHCVCSNIMECNGVQWVGTVFILCILNKEYISITASDFMLIYCHFMRDATQNSNFGSL